MATRTISTKLAIDGESQYREALKRINSEMKLMQSNLKLVESQFAENSGSMEALRARGTALADMHKTQSDKVKELKAALDNAKAAQEGYANKSQELTAKISANKAKMEELKSSAGNTAAEEARLAEETKKLEQELETNNRYLDAADRGVVRWQLSLNSAQAELNKLDAEISRNNSALEAAGHSADGAGERMQRMGDDVRNSAQSISDLDGLLAGAGAVAMLHKIADAFESCVKQSIEFESAMAGVKRTVGGSDEFIGDLGESFKELSTVIPLTAEDLASVATTAGQLGIAQENVESFTTVMAKLGTTTDLTADNAATMLAQFSNITGVSDYERLGAVVAELGDATATTASKVVDMSQGMAAAANIAGLSATDTMAIAAAVGSLGIEAQAGSTAMQTLISTLYKSTEVGGDTLKAFASVAGMTAEQFKEKWQTDAVGALDAFIQGLNDTERNGKSAIVLLEDLGITNVRQTKAILGLASAGDLLSKTVAQANRAWEENTALNEKAGIMYGTTEAKVTMLKNAFTNVKDAVGNQLTPALGRLSDKLVPLMTKFAEFVETNSSFVPLVLSIASTLGTLVVTVGGFAAAIKIATVAQAAFNLVMDANPILLVVSALAALTVGLTAYFGTIDDGVPSLEDLTAATQAYNETAEAARQTATESAEAAVLQAEHAEELCDTLDELGSKSSLTTEEQKKYNATIDQLRAMYPQLDIAIDTNTGKINGGTQAIRDQITELKNLAIEQAKQRAYAEIADGMVQTEIELTNNRNAYNQAVSDASTLQQQHTTAMEGYLGVMEQIHAISSDPSNYTPFNIVSTIAAVSDLQAEADKYLQQMENLKSQMDANTELQNNLATAISSGEDALAAYDEQVQTVSDAVDNLLGKSTEGLQDISDKTGLYGQYYVDGYVEGINGSASSANDAGAKVGEESISGIKAALESNSPSKKTEQVGKDFDQGFANGIKSNAKVVNEATSAMVKDLMVKTKQAGEEGANGFQNGFKKITSETQRTLQTLRSTISNSTSGLRSEMYSVGAYAVEGMINGLQNRSGRLYAVMRQIVTRSIQVAQDAAVVKSPSKKTEWIYANVIEGGIVGIEKNQDKLYRAMQNATDMSMAVKIDTSGLGAMASSVENGLEPPSARAMGYEPPDVSGIEGRIDALSNTLRETVDAVRAMRVVLDSGETVGAIRDQMDAELGQAADDFGRLEM